MNNVLRAFFVAAAASAIFVTQLNAQTVPTASDNPIFIDLRSAGPARESAATALIRKANARGQLRVIVGLTLSLRNEDSLNEIEAAAQTARLQSAQATLASRIGVAADDVTPFDTIPFVSMWVNASQLARLINDLGVVNIQEDVPAKAAMNKSARFIKADKIWAKGFKGKGFAVAILDTGVDWTHPMFAGRLVSEACFSTNKSGQGISSFCPGRASHSTARGSGLSCPGSLDPCWHGTHVAGSAVGRAVKHGSVTLRGIAPESKLIAIKVFSNSKGQVVTFDTDWVRGLERVYALRKKFKIASINMSLGFGKFSGPCDGDVPAAKKIIKKLRDAHIATLVASMNDSFDFFTRAPACITDAIAVGATQHTSNQLADFSNNAPWVRLLAPGVGIVSARAGGTQVNSCVNKGGGFCASDGTSMATPHVAGAFALMRDIRTNATIDDIAAALECTGPLVTRAGISKPRIDLLAAKNYLLNPPRTTLDFTFDSSASGWLSYFGSWSFFGGYLQAFDQSVGYKVAVVPHCNEGVDIAADVSRNGNDANNVQGIIFKGQFAGNTNFSGYLGAYNGAGVGILRRFDNYNLATDNGGFVNLCSGNASANGNHDIVKVETRGGKHSLFVNGSLVCSATDRTYGTGFAGIFAYFGAAGGNAIGVDRFIIQPQETVRKKGDAEELVSAAEPREQYSVKSVREAARATGPTAVTAGTHSTLR